jgi:hypothetical protein
MGVISDGTTMIDNGAFENLDVLSWDTTAKTGNFTAVAGNGYFVNTTSGAITVTLPAGSAGDSIGISDYAGTFATNACTVDPNGSQIVNGGPAGNPAVLRTTGLAVTLIYVDGTIGWKSISDTTNNVSGNIFTVATGGTIATVGDYKVHTFTSSGTFEITQAGTGPNSTVDYLVVAGGGGGGAPIGGGGGGAGGYRLSAGTYSGPARAGSSLSASVASFPITVGAGGGVNSPRAATGDDGSNSIFSTITSTGGGGGGATSPSSAGNSGGSGGGSGTGTTTTPTGNSPSTSPVQGFNGGDAPSNNDAGRGAGGGGCTEVGRPGGGNQDGGDGEENSITGGAVARGGGGGGGARTDRPGTGGAGGLGGGGNGSTGPLPGVAGTVNTGGGGGGGGTDPFGGGDQLGGAGGSGIVVIRYQFQ